MVIWIIFGVLLAVILYAWFIEPAFLDIAREEVELDVRKLTQPVRLLALSDLHHGKLCLDYTWKRKFHKLHQALEETPVDVILLAGDFIDRNAAYIPQLMRFIALLKTLNLPMCAIIGNHDYRSFDDKVAPLVEALTQAGVQVLENESAVIRVGQQKVLLVGLKELESTAEYQHNTNQSGEALHVVFARVSESCLAKDISDHKIQ